MVKEKKRKKRAAVVFYAYDSESLGICVGIPLDRGGDVLILYEAGYFWTSIKNMRGTPRKPVHPEMFMRSINERLEEADALRNIRSLLNHASRQHKKNHPGRFLKALFAKPSPRKMGKK